MVVTAEGEEIHTVAEMRAIWPTLIEHNAGVKEKRTDENYCLCGLDIPGSAMVNGARVTRDTQWGDYMILPPRVPEPAMEAQGQESLLPVQP